MIAARQSKLPLLLPKEKTLSERITELLQSQEGLRWQGTAYDLCQALDTCVSSPRSLAVKLKRSRDDLRRGGVNVAHKKLRGRHVIVLSVSRSVASALTKDPGTTTNKRCSKIAPEIAAIAFPFSWKYGKIIELNEDEKRAANFPVRNGHNRRHYCHCSLCGNGGPGVLEFVRESAGYKNFVCRRCAVEYVEKARRLTEKVEGKGR